MIHQFVPGKANFTLLLLHGTGGDENDLIPIGRSLAPGVPLLSLRGSVLENGASRFFRRLAAGVFDEEDIRVRSAELAAFVMDSAAKYKFDAHRVYALGYSNGANIAAATMLLHPSILAGGVLLRPMPPIEPETPPDLTGKQVLIIAGQQDQMTRPDLTEKLAQTLSRAHATLEVQWIAAGHELTPKDFQEIQKFIKGL